MDDDPSIRLFLRSLLSDVYEVQQAADGPEALRMLRQARWDLLIIDFLMPRMDGLALLRAVKEIKPDQCVLMLTGQIDADLAKKTPAGGAQASLRKPFRAEELKKAIAHLIEGGSRRAAGAIGPRT